MAKVIYMEIGEISMALIEYDAYKQKLRDLEPELKKLAAALDIDSRSQAAARSWRTRPPRTASGTTWSAPRRCRPRLKQLQNKLHRFKTSS